MPTHFVLVSATLSEAFWQEWRAIEMRYPHFTEPPDGMSLLEHWANMSSMRKAAREALRQELRDTIRLGFGGGVYPIAV